MYFEAFFKTKKFSILSILKSTKIKMFCDLEDIKEKHNNANFQGRGRPQGNIQKKENREFAFFSFSTGALNLTQ